MFAHPRTDLSMHLVGFTAGLREFVEKEGLEGPLGHLDHKGNMKAAVAGHSMLGVWTMAPISPLSMSCSMLCSVCFAVIGVLLLLLIWLYCCYY